MKETRPNKTIVVSGINLFTGGTLKVMQDCIASLSAYAGREYRIVALVHREDLYPAYPNVEYISFPKSRKSWLYRLYYEYIGFRKLSQKLSPYVWFSMHDTTPNVYARYRMVYCHNPFPFYKAGWKGLWMQPGIFLLSLLTRHVIYRVNIRKNDYIIVQQQWMREAFEKMFAVDNVIVAMPAFTNPPGNKQPNNTEHNKGTEDPDKRKTLFFYPATAMIHKNFELLCEATAILEKEGLNDFEVIITSFGSENKYAHSLFQRYGNLKRLTFQGYLKREQMDDFYKETDCLVFPSKAETWGLPLMEAKEYNKPVLVSNLPYAKETVGKYAQVKYFDPEDAPGLASLMKAFMQGTLQYDPSPEIIYEKPFARDWKGLFSILFPER